MATRTSSITSPIAMRARWCTSASTHRFWGHLLVAPVKHREHLVADLEIDEYVSLQRVVHRAGRALTSVIETERLYLLSLGSQEGNRHLHLHLVPLPPGVPYEKQQLAALAESRGFLDPPEEKMSALAAAISRGMRRKAMQSTATLAR